MTTTTTLTSLSTYLYITPSMTTSKLEFVILKRLNTVNVYVVVLLLLRVQVVVVVLLHIHVKVVGDVQVHVHVVVVFKIYIPP